MSLFMNIVGFIITSISIVVLIFVMFIAFTIESHSKKLDHFVDTNKKVDEQEQMMR